jgi:hypothetical protein
LKVNENKKAQIVKYMTDGIEYVIKTFEKRAPGSKGERDAQRYFAEELGHFADTVETEQFHVNPGSFMGWLYITATCLIAGLLTYFISPVITVILIAAGGFCMLSQLILYKTWLDPLFKQETSQNVYARKAPASGNIKRRIFLVGHADATWEWHWHYKHGYNGMVAIAAGAIAGALYLLGISITRIALTGFGFGLPAGFLFWLGLGTMPFLAFWLYMYKFSDTKTIVDGANDNLTACYMAMGVAKTLSEEGISLENTEFCVLLTGSEEAGLRGARAFCKKHKDDFDDVETAFIVFETLREEKELCVYTSEINHLYKTDKSVAMLVHNAGKANGIDIPLKSSSLAGTDSAAFGECGLKSTCIGALDQHLKEYYHTRKDSYDNLNPELLAKVFDITLTVIDTFDKKGLPAPVVIAQQAAHLKIQLPA